MTDLIHKFFLNDKYIVLDIYGGSLHIVDEIAYNIIDDAYDMSIDKILEKYEDKYDKKDIKEAYDEIISLRDEGYLFTEKVKKEEVKYHPSNIIKAMCLHVSHDCDLRCRYCFASQGDFKGHRGLMSYEVGKRALDFLVENARFRKNLEVDFFGGEPLLNFPVIKKLVEYGHQLNEKHNKNIRFTITTNGMQLDDEKIDFINENMVNVVMSLDGRKSINDNMRPTINNKGSYDIIVPKFKKLIEKRGNKDYYIRGTFTSKNLDFMKDAMSFYDEGFKNISIEPVVTDMKKSYALREEHLETVLQEYERFSKEYIKIKKRGEDFHFFHYMIDLDEGPCLAKRSVGCGAGTEYISVTPSGDIYPCHQFVGEKKFILGNIYEGIKNREIPKEFSSANVFEKEDCSKCWAKFYCSGGCHANAYYNNNTIHKPFKLGCEMEKKRVECAISILANLND